MLIEYTINNDFKGNANMTTSLHTVKNVSKLALLFTAAAALGTATTQAAPAKAAPVKSGKVGFVDVQKVIQGSAAGANYIKLTQKLNADLSKQLANLQSLQTKMVSGKATAADRTAFAKAQTAYQAAMQSSSAQRQKAFAPLASSVNSAVAQAAKAQGYVIVLDRQMAARGLVVYANNQSTDLTAAVQKYMKK